MAHKKQTKFNPQNGHEVVEYAKGQNGVEIHQKKDSRVVIQTSKGSMNVYDNKHAYSESDKSNIRRWLRIIGLLILLVGVPALCLWMNYVASLRAG